MFCSVLVTCTGTSSAVELDISGFGSFVGGIKRKDVPYLNYETNDLDFKPDSIAGVQISGQINEKASATVQIIANGVDNWNAVTDWAYVSYQPRSDFTWKLGRFRVPFFLYSEHINVGYTYPWISPPYSVYQIPFTSIDGLNAEYSISVNDIDLEFQAYGGGSRFEQNTGVLEDMETETRNQFGFVAQASWSSWLARMAVHQARLFIDTSSSARGQAIEAIAANLRADGYAEVADNLLVNDDRANFADAALQYDNDTFLFVLESSYFTGHDTTPVGANRNFYITTGIRDDAFTYHLTFGRAHSDAPDIASDLPESSPYFSLLTLATDAFRPHERSWTLGMRWDFAERMAFKSEVLYLPDFQAALDNGKDEFNMTILRMGIQTIF